MLLSGNTYGLPTMDSIDTGGVGGKVSVQGPLKLTFFCKKKYTCYVVSRLSFHYFAFANWLVLRTIWFMKCFLAMLLQ